MAVCIGIRQLTLPLLDSQMPMHTAIPILGFLLHYLL